MSDAPLLGGPPRCFFCANDDYSKLEPLNPTVYIFITHLPVVDATSPNRQLRHIEGKRVGVSDEVIAGRHCTGHTARQDSLGISASQYKKVRAEVNHRAGVKKPKVSTNSISFMATEVLAGKHGKSHARRRRSLGISKAEYAEVHAEVNRCAADGGSSSSGGGKSISQMATEVIQGKHGNGHANRQRSLGLTNATYAKALAEVNRRS